MKTIFTALAFVMLVAAHSLRAQASPPLGQPEPASPKIIVDPSFTKVPLGKASLIVNALTRSGNFYIGDYQLKVMPYFFLGEKGTLKLDALDDDVRKLLAGNAMKFTGKATNNKQGAPRAITGKIMPATPNGGSATFTVETDRGPLTFNTSYHFGS